MFRKYFMFTKKRSICFGVLVVLMLAAQYMFTGNLVSNQQVITEAGNSNSAVIGILDETEVVRQKFSFDRKVKLSAFTINFGSFKRDNVGDTLDIQMLDGNNTIVFETKVPVDKIKANSAYTVTMDQKVNVDRDTNCCIRISCSSDKNEYELIPTLNTTNRTDPNTYMATLNMQTHAKSLDISYNYSYFQVYPLILFVFELLVLFVIGFERLTTYIKIYEKREIKDKKHGKKRTIRGLRDFIKWIMVSKAWKRNWKICMIVLNPLILFWMIENMSGSTAIIGPMVWIFSWLLLGLIQAVLYAVFGNISLAMLVMDLILFPAGVANIFLMTVRGTPFLPVDLLSLKTGMEVASTYSLSFAPAEFVIFPMFIIWCVILCRTYRRNPKNTWKKRLFKSTASLIPACALIGVLYNTPVLENCGIKDNVWNKVSSCRANGFYLNFFLNLHYLRVSAPNGFSADDVSRILDTTKKGKVVASTVATGSSIQGNSQFTSNTSLNGKKPNIILIMNESLADFSLAGNVNYNKDPLPYLHSMKKNTIRGVDYVSVFGAGTSNSEFEAMTGNSMAYFPSGCNVYQQFMHDSTFSLPSYLKELGYSTKAVHPSSGANWNRIAAYQSMKFDDFLTIDDFKNPEYVRYISDKESYKKVIELYEKKGDDPLFVFDMTIQNHGGYLTNTDWDDPIYVKDTYYSEAKEYLSSIHVSDQAFKYLTDYFSKQKEPTLICMFGDHFPSVEDDFYTDLLGKSSSQWNLEDIQKRYGVPFVIWANYDIQESDNAVIGNNYLENMILKQAGIELPLYNQYIEQMSQVIPAMNVNGYMDLEGTWHNYNSDKESEEVKTLLRDYSYLQYGYYSDTDKEKMGKLFEMTP